MRKVILTAHNCQKLKSRFLTCHSHDINMKGAVGLYISNYNFKISIFMSMRNLGQFC